MRLSSYISAALAGIVTLASCNSVKRALSTETGDPSITPERLTQLYSPAGRIEERIHKCTVEGPSQRRLLVYLPAGYDAAKDTRYPVLYLFHGARGNESSWFTKGRIVPIVDSLRSASLAKDFIIVLPNMNSYKDDEDFGGSRFKNPFESFFGTDGRVETAFMKDVVGFIDSTYRTIPDKKHRACAGLSVGALQSIYISAHNPSEFGYVGLFSGMYKAPIKKSQMSDYYKSINKLWRTQFLDPPQVYLLMIGTADFFYPHNEYFRQYLTQKGYDFQYYETGGGHDWPNWKEYFSVFIQRCF